MTQTKGGPMKINITVDTNAEEMRKLMGLPDVEPFQRELMEELTSKMKAGIPEYDPIKLFEFYTSRSLAAWDAFQNLMAGAARSYGQGGKKKQDEG
jgi:hypothetical protein